MLSLASANFIVNPTRLSFYNGNATISGSVTLNDVEDYTAWLLNTGNGAKPTFKTFRINPYNLNLEYEVQNLSTLINGVNFNYCNITITRHYADYGDTWLANINVLKPIFNGQAYVNPLTTYNFSVDSFNIGLSTRTVARRYYSLRGQDYIDYTAICNYTGTPTPLIMDYRPVNFNVFVEPYSCASCTEYTKQQLANLSANQDSVNKASLSIYNKAFFIIDKNYYFWLVFSNLFKIASFFVAIGLLFYTGLFIANLFNKLAKRLKNG